MSTIDDLIKFPFPPDQETYALTDGTAVVSTQLDGGSARYRTDLLDVAGSVVVQWTLDPSKYNYWKAFFKTKIQSGALPFALDLYMDLPILTTHEVHIVPGTLTLSSQSGLTFVLGCTLEAIPLPTDDDANNAYIFLYDTYGDGGSQVLSLLEKLCNVDLPGIAPAAFYADLDMINTLVNVTMPTPGYW